jgi:hypothetical protein
MKKYIDGELAPWGVYVSPRALDARVVNADDEPLEGKPGAEYLRVPTILAVVASLMLGALFVMTFPLVIFGAFVVGTVQLIRTRPEALAVHEAHGLATARADDGSSDGS